MTTICQLLQLSRLCPGFDLSASEQHCNVTVGPARPLLCTNCRDPVEPYNCVGVKFVETAEMHMSLALTNILDVAEMPQEMSLSPGTAVLHQWRPLGDLASWEAGLISAAGDDLILWRPEHDRGAIHLPKSKVIDELYTESPAHSPSLLLSKPIMASVAAPGRYEAVQQLRQTLLSEALAKNEEHQKDIKLHATEPAPTTAATREKDLRPANTLDLLYILDSQGALKVDAWRAGKYLGFIAVEVQKPEGGWEPVFLNGAAAGNSSAVFFASTRALSVSDLDIREILH